MKMMKTELENAESTDIKNRIRAIIREIEDNPLANRWVKTFYHERAAVVAGIFFRSMYPNVQVEVNYLGYLGSNVHELVITNTTIIPQEELPQWMKELKS